jgi:hypothetical protein
MFGLSLTSTVRDREDTIKKMQEYNDSIFKKNQTLNADLMAARADSREAIRQRDKAVSDLNLAIDSHKRGEKRLGFIDTQLYEAGKTIKALLRVWKFREENPKMSPKDRVQVNKDLNTHLTALDTQLPKRVPAYSDIPKDWKVAEVGDPPKDSLANQPK